MEWEKDMSKYNVKLVLVIVDKGSWGVKMSIKEIYWLGSDFWVCFV